MSIGHVSHMWYTSSMSSQYAKGRRHEEELVNLLKGAGFDASRVELSGRWRKDKADIIINFNGSDICASVKYGSQVPKSLYKADMVIYPGVISLSWPNCGNSKYEANKLPKFLADELELCQLFFGKRARQPWKVAFASDLCDSYFIKALTCISCSL